MSLCYLVFSARPSEVLLKSRYFSFEELGAIGTYNTYSRMGGERPLERLPDNTLYTYLLVEERDALTLLSREIPEAIFAYVLLEHNQSEEGMAEKVLQSLKRTIRMPVLTLEEGATVIINQPYCLCDDLTLRRMRHVQALQNKGGKKGRKKRI